MENMTTNNIPTCNQCGHKFDIRNAHYNGHGVARIIKILDGVRIYCITGLHSWNTANLCTDCIITILTEDDAPEPTLTTLNQIKRTITYIPKDEYPLHILANNIKQGSLQHRWD